VKPHASDSLPVSSEGLERLEETDMKLCENIFGLICSCVNSLLFNCHF